jgi:hypothetical protein
MLGCHGNRQRGQRRAEELHGGHGHRVAALQQPGLRHREGGGQQQRCQHQAVAANGRPAAAAARDESHAGQRDGEACPCDWPGHGPVPDGGDDRDDHGSGADQQSRIADAGPADARVLHHDRAAVTDRPGQEHGWRECGPELGPGGDKQDRRGQGEPHERQPRRRQPLQGQLGQRHGRAPEQSGCSERGEGGVAVAVHTPWSPIAAQN